MTPPKRNFWQQALALKGSVTPTVLYRIIAFGFYASIVQLLSRFLEKNYQFDLGIEANPFEIAGAVLGVLLVFRTNAGYDRWWEARKLWGGIVNQSRNLAVNALAYGPRDAEWRTEIATWIAVFPHVTRASLRGEAPDARVEALLGKARTAQLAAADHMPTFVSLRVGQLLQSAVKTGGMEQFAFLQADGQRSELIDHMGGCERILKTPLPLVYVIKIRQFILLFLLALPLALLHELQSLWLIPLITMGVAYPLLALDQIGVELQNPFFTTNLSHLPLNDICFTIEKNVRALCETDDCAGPLAPPPIEPDETGKNQPGEAAGAVKTALQPAGVAK